MNHFKQCAFGAVMAAAAMAPAWSATLSVVPAASGAAVGSSVAVDVVVAGLNAGQQLASFDFTLNFNAGVLSLGGYSLGAALGSVVAFEAIDASAGAVGPGAFNVSEVSFLLDLSAQPASFTLATLTFSGLAAGSSALGLTGVTLGDAFGEAIAANVAGSTLAVTAVPEPASCALLLSGLVLLGGAARRRHG